MGKRLTHEEFSNRINQLHPEIEFLSKYVNAKTRIKCHCKICDYIWNPSPDTLNLGCGCPNCANQKKHTIKLKSHETFIDELKKIQLNIKVLGEYVNARTKIKCKCLVDEHEWSATPDNLLRGTGCPKCAGKIQSTEIFKNRLKDIQCHIDVLGEYINNYTKIKCYCKKHEVIFYATPSDLLSGKGCKYCKSEKISNARKLSQSEFVDKIQHLNSDVDIIGEYINAHEKVLVKCKVCGTKFDIIPNNASNRGVNCPCCYEKDNISKGEKLVKDYLSNNNLYFIQNHKFDNLFGINSGLLSYDFYLPHFNSLIEVQGLQHKEVVEYFGGLEKFLKQQEHDKRKREYAKKYDYKLIEIWYDEFNNIDSILTEKLLQIS